MQIDTRVAASADECNASPRTTESASILLASIRVPPMNILHASLSARQLAKTFARRTVFCRARGRQVPTTRSAKGSKPRGACLKNPTYGFFEFSRPCSCGTRGFGGVSDDISNSFQPGVHAGQARLQFEVVERRLHVRRHQFHSAECIQSHWPHGTRSIIGQKVGNEIALTNCQRCRKGQRLESCTCSWRGG